MNTLSHLTISKTINKNINASIIPILLTDLNNKTLFNYVSKFIPVPEPYTSLFTTIEDNIKDNNLGMASFTIEYNNTNNNNNNSIINNKLTHKLPKNQNT